MKIYNNPQIKQWPTILKRPGIETKNLELVVQKIMLQVQQDGDTGLIQITEKFDGVRIKNIEVSQEEIKLASQQIDPELKAAIQQAKKNIELFHASQQEEEKIIETMPGVQCWRKSVAIEKVGLYIPGGTAPLFSTVLMLGVPAQIAGCTERILCTPPQKDGSINPAILFTAQLVGIEKIFKVGGAQAIAAMTYGTEIIPSVNKIFGPGNQYVTEAKQQASRVGVSIDMPAGPSEVLVVADQTANAAFVAADLLSQAEHGADSQVVLIAFEDDFVAEVLKEINTQVDLLPRKEIAQEALKNSVAIIVENKKKALDIINFYAPEHLILAIERAELFSMNVRNAGSIFLGNFTPESVGDYASGTNHTLPTNGFAKMYSGVSLDSFVKKVTVQKISKTGLKNIGPIVEKMAAAEQLEAHKNAVSIRLDTLGDELSEEEIKSNSKSNTSLIQSLVRPDLRNFKPYSSARDEFEGEAKIFLDANENPFQTNINRYPDPMQSVLKNKISEIKGIDATKIFLGNGSDEAIDLLIRLFCENENDSILVLPPTYGVYSVFAKTAGVRVKTLPLGNDFQPSLKKLSSQDFKDSKILFICNPNNPSGSIIPLEMLEKIIKAFSGIVVVDEAYIDFSETKSCINIIDENPNLVVLQTFSKAWGMAGVRLGMAFSNPELISWVNKIKMPYNINQLTQQAVLTRLENKDQVLKEIELIKRERTKLSKQLKDLNFIEKVFSSEANFILAKVINADKLYSFLLEKGIIIRNRSSQLNCEDCLRFSIGTPSENQQLIEALFSFQKNVFNQNLLLQLQTIISHNQKIKMKKILFIDRDGTLIIEPPTDYQVDSFEKLEYYPKVFQYLSKIAVEFDYELVMITNQDGLGTKSFPEETFWPVHNKMVEAFKNEGVHFSEIIIDKTFPEENAPTRKPGTALLNKYLNGTYDLENSYVLGDRLSDIQLAKNLKAKGILIQDKNSFEITDELKTTCALVTLEWQRIYEFLKFENRTSSVKRTTSETDISIELSLDGNGQSDISTGLGFFDHMLEQIAKHSGADLSIKVQGDLQIDEHHTIEDTALALGEAFYLALGNKESIERYGFCLPMDDCLAQVALDFGGRPWLVWEADFKREKIGDMPTEMFMHFFKSFSDASKSNLNIKVEGNNEHHKIEAIFKAFAKSIKMAIRRDVRNVKMPSTKGVL